MTLIEKFESFVEAVLRGAVAIGAILIVAPLALVFGGIGRIAKFVLDLLIRAWRFVSPALLAFLAWLGDMDPFRLRQYGKNMLSDSVRLNLDMYSLLLLFSLAFELFAWSNMWGYSGIEGMALRALPVIFAGMVILLDRGILVMDDPHGGKRLRVIFARMSMLLLLAMITAIPVELRVFAPEIDRVILDAEKVQVDAIREKARASEIDLAKQQKVASASVVTSQPQDVVERRQTERAALVAQQTADRREITARLTNARESVAEEVERRSKERKTRGGSGVTAAELRSQASQTREELESFSKVSREQLKDFDTETERMRSEAAEKGVSEISRRDLALAEKLQAIEAMSSSQVAMAYGGEYEQPNGFLARYRTLLTLVEGDRKNQMIVWGCRLVMIVFGLSVMIVKFAMTSSETMAYYSLRAQALSGNRDAVRVFIAEALVGDKEAIAILRKVASENEDAASALRKLGYNANVEASGWSNEVRELHERHQAAQNELNAALVRFRIVFGDLCKKRVGIPAAALERHRLMADAQYQWNQSVQPKVSALAEIEGQFATSGVAIREWRTDLEEKDPRHSLDRLWNLSDNDLIEQFGWSTSEFETFRSAPMA